MYSRIHLNEEFQDEFLIYNDIFAVRTRCVQQENRNSISEMQPKWLVLRRYQEYIHLKRRIIMLLEEMRQKVVDYGNQLISSGLTIW